MSKIDKNGNIEITPASSHLKEGAKNGSFRERSKSLKDNSVEPNYKGGAVGIFGIIILILFVVAFSHYIRTGTFIDFSFKSMIDYLATMPDVSLQFMQIDLTAYGDWGLFNFAKSIWNFIAPLFEFSITITGMITQSFVVIWFLVTMLFI